MLTSDLRIHTSHIQYIYSFQSAHLFSSESPLAVAHSQYTASLVRL